jgi:alpha-tubulin suppressor-like RCC1 family protein
MMHSYFLAPQAAQFRCLVGYVCLLGLLVLGPLAARAQAVAAGSGFSFSIHADGTLWASGYNGNGQLGDGGAPQSRVLPVRIGTQRWQTVASGSYFTEAIRSDGSLWAWGRNDKGELGDGTNLNRAVPVRVGTATNWRSLALGANHTLALKADGTLWAWGRDDNGQLGDGTTDGNVNSSPVQVGTDTWRSIAASQYHSLAVRTDGTLWAWGFNGDSQLGDGTTTQRAVPTQIGSLTTWRSVAAGSFALHGVAIRTDGTLWAWGRNVNNQLGNGTATVSRSPVQIGSATTWKQAVVGPTYTVALRTDGTLWGWGNNDYGQLGDGSTTNQATPAQMGTVTTWQALSTGNYHTLALRTDNSVWAFGWNSDGQLGSPDAPNPLHATPTQVGTALDWAAAAVGSDFTVATKTTGELLSWGENISGQLGQGSALKMILPTPAPVAGAATWQRGSAGLRHGAGIRSDGSLWGWGQNGNGQTGQGSAFNNPPVSTPVPVSAGSTWQSLSAGQEFTLAIRTDGTLWAWGLNNVGQLGDGTTVTRPAPVQVGTDANWLRVSAGVGFALGLRTDGTLWAWGTNGNGQLGDGTTTQRLLPVPIGSATWQQVAAGSAHGAALRADGTLWTWGYNGNGQLGDGTTTQRLSPVPIGAAVWQQVAAGGSQTFGLRPDGSLWSSGYNASGQLGDGTTTQRTTFARVGAATWQSVATGATASHTVGVQADGSLWAWGLNSYGQTGLPITAPAPVLVSPAQAALPVELTAFTATAEGPTAVRLAWATATEKHSQAFEVERSTDGERFAAIGTVAAAGTSSAPRSYELLDGQLPTTAATRYYRLRQVDLDGTFSYSPVRTVAFKQSLSASVTLFPNPAHGAAMLTGAQPGTVVTVFDALGRPVLSAPADAAGTAALGLPAGLSPGVYVVRTGPQALRLTVE